MINYATEGEFQWYASMQQNNGYVQSALVHIICGVPTSSFNGSTHHMLGWILGDRQDICTCKGLNPVADK
jgi:hypothetical protein